MPLTIYPVILAGGTGTRLWPYSRKSKPKQFLPLTSDRTMFMETLNRVDGKNSAFNVKAPVVVCSDQHTDLVISQCETLDIQLTQVISEPTGRNSAPAVLIASLVVQAIDPDSIVLVLPADHFIADVAGFWTAVDAAAGAADRGRLVTLGIAPDRPETGYGYIKTGSAMADNIYELDAFTEKPEYQTAEKYLEEGGYYWNAGIFVGSANSFIREFATHAADILAACKETLRKSEVAGDVLALDESAFANCRSESIDYAIMEHTDRGAIVAPVDIGWSDIGDWNAVRQLCSDAKSQHPAAPTNTICVDTMNTHIQTDGIFVAAIGVEDLVIVATKDAVLVTRADQAQKVRHVVTQLQDSEREELL